MKEAIADTNNLPQNERYFSREEFIFGNYLQSIKNILPKETTSKSEIAIYAGFCRQIFNLAGAKPELVTQDMRNNAIDLILESRI